MVTENRYQTAGEVRKHIPGSLTKPLMAVVTKALAAFGLAGKGRGSRRLNLAALEG